MGEVRCVGVPAKEGRGGCASFKMLLTAGRKKGNKHRKGIKICFAPPDGASDGVVVVLRESSLCVWPRRKYHCQCQAKSAGLKSADAPRFVVHSTSRPGSQPGGKEVSTGGICCATSTGLSLSRPGWVWVCMFAWAC